VRRALLPHPLTSAALLLVWLLAHNGVTPGLLVLGTLLAVAVPLVTRAFWPERPRVVRYAPLARLTLVVLFDIVVANVIVARLVLGPRSRLRPRFIELPLELESPYAVTMLASIISLTPGTVSSNLSGDHRTLLVHGLDVPDARAAAARIKARYEAPLKEIFGC